MINKLFCWSIKNGAQILFASAIIILVIGLISPIYMSLTVTRHMASHLNDTQTYPFETINIISSLQSAIGGAGWLFLAAVVVDRIDHWKGRSS